MAAEWRVAVDGEAIRALHEPATAAPLNVVIACAPGAGGHRDDRSMQRLADTLTGQGFDVVRFNFPYQEKGSRRPDPMPRLRACFEAVAGRIRRDLPEHRLVIGGRSMGGRVASLMAADGFRCDGLLLLAYPLHPAGLHHQLRDEHLPRIAVPVLCINGTRDALCDRDLMEKVLVRLGENWRMHWLEGADHSFHVLKSSGRTDDDVLQEVGRVCRHWLE